MSGLSATGFSIKRLNDIIAELKVAAEQEFASLVQPGDIVNTSDTSVIGRWIKTVAAPLADLWEVSQEVYSAMDINQATGQALDNLCLLGGVIRKQQTASTASLELCGDYGTVIPAGSSVKSNINGLVFETDYEITLDVTKGIALQFYPSVANNTTYAISYQISGIHTSPVVVNYTSDSSATVAEIVNGMVNEINTNHSTYLTATTVGVDGLVELVDKTLQCDFTFYLLGVNRVKKAVTATCTTLGANENAANTLTSIQSPVVGWNSVTNSNAAVSGTELETDDSLRARYLASKFIGSTNTYEAIYAALLALDGVSQVYIYENETDTPLVSPPVPAHSFFPIVLGGNNNQIAQAIWNNKPAGIGTYGGITVSVTDSQGVAHDVKFSRPTDVPIYIEVTIVTDSNYPVDGDDQIKAALVAHFSSYVVGQDVLVSRLYTPINSVAGHYITGLLVDTVNPAVASSNITITYSQRAVITAANITIVS